MSSSVTALQNIPMFEPVSAAQGFTAMVRPHLMFIEEAHQRQRVADACQHAWNIGTLGGAAEREAAIVALGHEAALRAIDGSRLASSEIEMLRALVEQRCQTFPFLRTVIREARLSPGPSHDELAIESTGGNEVMRVTWRPTLTELPLPHTALAELGSLLPQMPNDVRAWLHCSTTTPDVWATRARNRCRLLLLELSTYRAMIAGIEATGVDAEGHRFLNQRLDQLGRVERWALVFLDAMGRNY